MPWSRQANIGPPATDVLAKRLAFDTGVSMVYNGSG